MASEKTKTVADSTLETAHIIMPRDMNNAGRLFGGTLMSWIDETAAIVARRHSECAVTTASVDSLQFLHGAYQGDIVVLSGQVTYVGNTSMEVRVTSYVEKKPEDRKLINVAYLTLVALDENDKPRRVPRLQLTSPEEQEEWERARERKEKRTMETPIPVKPNPQQQNLQQNLQKREGKRRVSRMAPDPIDP